MSEAEPRGEVRSIPIFPLHTVLFPGMVLPLSACDARERELLARCLDTNTPAGIVLQYSEGTPRAGTLARTGCLVEIRDYERHVGGRHTVLVSATGRFEALDAYESPCCSLGRVRKLPEVSDIEPADALVNEARDLLQVYLAQVLTLVGGQNDEVKVIEAPQELSYLIGMSLCCDEEARQQLLEVDTVSARLRLGCTLLRAEIEGLSMAAEAQESGERTAY